MRPAVFIICVVAACSSFTSADIASDMAQFLVVQNEQAKSKLGTIKFTFNRQYERQPQENSHIRAAVSGEWILSGSEQWARTIRHSQYSDRPKDIQDETCTAFIGKRSSAIYTKGTALANEFEHDDVSRLSDRESNLIGPGFDRNPMLEAFGIGNRFLRDVVLANPGAGVRWEGAKSEDSKYELRRHVPGRSLPDIVLTIDPSRGWLIVDRKWWVKDGQLLEEAVITATRRETDDLWYPTKVHCVRYSDVPNPVPPILYNYSTVITSLTPNAAIPTNQFSVDSLALPPGAHLVRISADGATTSFAKTAQGLSLIVQRGSAQHGVLAQTASGRRIVAVVAVASTAALVFALLIAFVRRRMKGGSL